MLASSRSGVVRDDRGAAFAKLVGGLTTYQLRSHCLFYDGFKRLFNGIYGPDAIFINMHRHQMFVPDSDYSESLSIEEGDVFHDIELHSYIGLVRNDLIARETLSGNVGLLKSQGYAADEDGQVVGLTMAGIELYHWAHGLGEFAASHFLDPTVDFEFEASIRKLTKIKPRYLPLPEPEGWPVSALPVANPLT